LTHIHDIALEYIASTILINHSSIPSFRIAHLKKFQGTRTKAFAGSTKMKQSSVHFPRYFSRICQRMKIASVVPRPGMKPKLHGVDIDMSSDNGFEKSFHKLSYLIQKFATSVFPCFECVPFPLKQLITKDKLQSLGILPSATIGILPSATTQFTRWVMANSISSLSARSISTFMDLFSF